jgi:hypothetical protein
VTRFVDVANALSSAGTRGHSARSHIVRTRTLSSV